MGSSHGAVKGLPPAFWRLEGCPLPSSWRPQGPLRCHPPPAREACCQWALRISNFGGCSLATFLAPCVKRRLRQPSTSGQANPESQDEPRLPVTFTEYQAQLSPDGTCFPPARRGPLHGERREGPRGQAACAAASVRRGCRRGAQQACGGPAAAGGSAFGRTTRGGSPPAPTPPLHSPEPPTLHRSARPWGKRLADAAREKAPGWGCGLAPGHTRPASARGPHY